MLVLDAARVGGRAAWGHAAPHPAQVAALRCRSIGLLLLGCVRPGTRGGRVLLPLTASRGGGAHGGGRPLAAARGCRLLRHFFFLLKTRNVILAGPRQGQASLRSVRTRTLDMAFSARIGTAQEGGRKRKMPQQPAASRPGAVPHVLLPAATARSGGQGGAQAPAGAPLQHTALRKTPGKKTVEVFENLRSARCAQERQPLCRSISTPEKCWKTAVRRSWPSGCSSTGRLGTGGRPANHTTRPAPSRGQVQADRPPGGAQHHSGTAQTGVWLWSAHIAVRNSPPSLREACMKGACRDHHRQQAP
jgi:hypothetical protein